MMKNIKLNYFIAPILFASVAVLFQYFDSFSWQLPLLTFLAICAANWTGFIAGKQIGQCWAMAVLLLLLNLGVNAWIVRNLSDMYSTYYFPDKLFLLTSLSIYLFSFVWISRHSELDEPDADSALLATFYHQLVQTASYAFFAILTLIVVLCGMELIKMVVPDFKQWIPSSAYSRSAMIGALCGVPLIFTYRLTGRLSQYSIPYLDVFQKIMLGFALIYIVLQPFTSYHFDSKQRLSAAAFLWLLAVLASQRKQAHLKLNLLTALAGLILVGLSLYGIIVRLMTQGITENRLYVLMIALMLLVAHLMLRAKVFLSKRHLAGAGRIYRHTLLAIAIIALITALLPLRAWSLDSQTARYLDGRKDAKELEIYYFEQFGKQGEQALQQISEKHHLVLNKHATTDFSDGKWQAYIQRIPADLPLQEAFAMQLLKNEYESHNIKTNPPPPIIVAAIDADHNPQTDELVVFVPIENTFGASHYVANESGWYTKRIMDHITISREQLVKLLEKQEIEYVPPLGFYDVVIDGKRLFFSH